MMSENTSWTLSKIWNESLEQRPERPVESREHLWASELGRSNIDLYLKMKGTEPTNPPNARSLRKFEAGNIWEWIIKLILMRCGIYGETQTYVREALPGLIEVSGKLDFIAGGKPNYAEAAEKIDNLELPELFNRAAKSIIEYFKVNYPDGLDEKILEVKSLSSFAFDRVEATEKAIPGHDLQLFHYAHNLQKEGAICYICRDDARMAEIPILPNDESLLERYKAKIETVTKFLREDTMPDNEKMMVYDTDYKKFSKNFNVEYSPFLTMLYGFAQPSEYADIYAPMAERFNRVLGRVVAGKDLTDNNKAALAEMAEIGFNPVEIINQIKTS